MAWEKTAVALLAAFALFGCISGLPINLGTPTPAPTPTPLPPTPGPTPAWTPAITPEPTATPAPTPTPTATATPAPTPTPCAADGQPCGEIPCCSGYCHNGQVCAPAPTPTPVPTPTPTPTPTPACVDSDGGQDPWVRGTATGYLRGEWGVWRDDCDATGAALEYYCTADGKVEFVKIACPQGCNNGVCRGTRPSGSPTPQSLCGNGVCGPGEDWTNCCKDCGCPSPDYYCRDYSPGCLPWLPVH